MGLHARIYCTMKKYKVKIGTHCVWYITTMPYLYSIQSIDLKVKCGAKLRRLSATVCQQTAGVYANSYPPKHSLKNGT